MRRKMNYGVLLAILIGLLLLTAPALAGGWVVVTLDALPGPIRAGETVQLGFMVRQHGVRPTSDVSPRLTAVNGDTGQTISAEAEQVGQTGHFEVSFRFPEAGVWEWQLSVPPFPQEVTFEPLTVTPAAAGEAAGPEGTAGEAPALQAPAVQARRLLRWGGAALLGLAALLDLLGQRRRQEAVAPSSTG